MKLFPDSIYSLRITASRQNIQLLLWLVVLTFVLVTLYSAVFLYLMAEEGQDHTWITAVYWTTTNMSTLGIGDIVFLSDIGRAFTVVVHISGLMILLVFIPFLFVQLFQSTARAPRELPRRTRGHVVLTHYDPITIALIDRLNRYQYPYLLIIEELTDALYLYDQGLRVMVGDLHDSSTFVKARVHRASLVASTASDQFNTNITYTIREIASDVPLITTGHGNTSIEVLKGAGSSHVLGLPGLVGRALGRRVLGADAMAHIVGQVDTLLIAEAMASGTPLVGKPISDGTVSSVVGSMIVGVMERGEFKPATPETVVTSNTVMILAGEQEQIDRYNELLCIYHASDAPVLIVGAGRVGKATANTLRQRGISYRFIERDPGQLEDDADCVVGNALEPSVLTEAGIDEAPAVILTSHEDDTNIFLTTYIRRLRENVQISSRTTEEKNYHTLHQAGADFVISYASMGANAIFNYLRKGNVLMVSEGLNVFTVPVPKRLVGSTIGASNLERRSGCCMIAVKDTQGMHLNPQKNRIVEKGSEFILMGTGAAEEMFLRTFVPS